MKIVDSILRWVIKKRIHQIELFMKYPHEVQEEWFSKLILTARNTKWGKRYDYKSIHTLEDYKNRVPVQDYDGFKKEIIQLKQGEQNILWPTEVKWFAKSSGTTSDKSKFIPVSREALEECHYKGGKDMLSIYYSNYPGSQMLSGRSLAVGGSQQVNQFSSDSYYGDLSAIILKNLPFWAEIRRTPNLSIALMDEWEEKIQIIAETTANENVTNIAGVPSWTLVLLKRILEITGKDNLLEVWPNLELYIHGGVSFTPYRDQYNSIIPKDSICYLETYNASEGFFGIQDRPGADDMLLMLDYGIYYEFMPMEELGKDDPKTLLLEEVVVGKNYAIIITTNGGLWRYLIGDTVQFTSTDPFRIKVTGRTKHFINAFGEEIIIENAETALDVACTKTNSVLAEYTAAPIYMDGEGKGGHEWLIEFETPPKSTEYFAEVLDNALKSVNSDYEAKRYKSIALDVPQVMSLPEGTFYNWMRSRGKLGGQNKIPRLSNDRKFVDDLLKFTSENLRDVAS